MRRISISFKKFTDVNFKKKGEFIYSSLKDNVHFITLTQLLGPVKIALDKYSADLAAAGTNDRNAIAQKNQSRKELEALLKQLGMAVMAEANGEETLLVESGFTLVKERQARYITHPGNVTVTNGISTGQMVTSVKTVPGAKSYVHQIATTLPDETTVWVSVTATGSKNVFENLIPGKQYWVRVAVVGSRKQIAYSNIASWFVQ